ncbi:MAG TPA: hypothetical protein VMV71_00100 [Candidatus Paceibacterota bacterium]|nr:hypothetical protein [Candidatus Paceibacterota bacterium]
MTFFQPERRSLINYVIGALIAASLVASFMVIWAYNSSVTLGYEISADEVSIRKIQTDKSQLQDKIFTLLNNSDVQKLANGALVEENNPQYFKTSPGTGSDLAASN